MIDLGIQPLANNLLKREDLVKKEPKYPLRVAICETCWLLQIIDIVPPAAMFSEYLYFSSFSPSLLKHAREAATRYISELKLDQRSLVIEIASNDGYLLQNFTEQKIPSLGIEPAANIAKVAREKGIETLVEFFSPELATSLAREQRQADLLLGNNVFAHVPNTNAFVQAVNSILKPGGTAIFEFPYGVDLITHTEFDTIYHEHVFYFTLTPLIPLFVRYELEIWRVEQIPIHGGSLRLFVSHKNAREIESSVHAIAEAERKKGVASREFYESFATRVAKLKEDLCALIDQIKRDGKRLAAYGAAAKGSTLLNFYGIGHESLEFVADRSTFKQGRLTPGTHIPIMPAETLLERMPDYTLLLTWNFAEEILRQQEAYRNRGGKFIVPIPEVRVV